MSLLDVDLDAPRRIEGTTAAGLRALGEVRQRSEDVGKAAGEMFERRERARRELEEQVRQAAAENGRTEDKADDEDRPTPRRTLSLGGEEFHQGREAKQAETPMPAAAPPPPEPKPEDEPARPGRTLKLGARDDAGEEPPGPGATPEQGARAEEEPRPARRPRPPRPEGDDDMSGRTWLR